jgi:hypothetical protein
VKEVHETGSGPYPMVDSGTSNTKLWVQLEEMKSVVSSDWAIDLMTEEL